VGRARLPGLALVDTSTTVPDADRDGMFVARWTRS
jgi:hypothetical protein